MLIYNTMRFATDTFEFDEKRTALFTSEIFSSSKGIKSFVVSGSQPDNTDRRFCFLVNNNLCKFSGNSLVTLSGSATADFVLANGNSAQELQALSNVLVDTSFCVVVALKALGKPYPSLKISCTYDLPAPMIDVLEKTVTSDIFELGKVRTIDALTLNATTNGQGSASAQVRLRNNNSWSAYMALSNAANRSADALQFNLTYKVVNVNSDSVKIDSIVVTFK